MKKILSVILFSTIVAGLVYAASFDPDVTFDAPVARSSVPVIRVKFLQVDFDNQVVEAFYVLPSNGGAINSAILFSGDDFTTFPQPGNTISNLLLRAGNRLKQMGATNGLSLK